MGISFRPCNYASIPSPRKPEGPEKRLDNTPFGSNSRWLESPGGHPRLGMPETISTNCDAHQSAANRTAKDTVPIHRNALRTRETSHKVRIHPAATPPESFPPTRNLPATSPQTPAL